MTDPGATTDPAADRRRRRRWTVTAAVGVVLALVVASIVYVHRRGGVRAGTLVEVMAVTAGGRTVTVNLPSGVLTVRITPAFRRMPSGAIPVGQEDRDAVATVRDFGRYVGVDWALDRVRTNNLEEDLVEAPHPKQFSLALSAVHHTYDLRAGEGSDRDLSSGINDRKELYLAVPGNPKSMTLRVGYDGVTQTVDLPTGTVHSGLAAPYYAGRLSPFWKTADCTSARLKAPGFAFDYGEDGAHCQNGNPFTTPYVAAVGWAKPGRSWLVMRISTSVSSFFLTWPSVSAARTALYKPRLRVSTVTADGATAAATVDYYQQTNTELIQDNQTAAFYVFDVPAAATTHTVALHQEYIDSTPDADPSAPANAPRSAKATVDVTFRLTR